MVGDKDEGIFSRLLERFTDPFGTIAPISIVRRTETLTIVDYRPTLMMLLTAVGFVGAIGTFGYFWFFVRSDAAYGLWAAAIVGAACFGMTFLGTIREVYHFDKTADSYSFVRQFIHRKEVINGSLSQFTGAYVKTVEGDNVNSYLVMLKQEGMFLTGVSEQSLRESVPIFNSFNAEAKIANEIRAFLPGGGR